MYITKYIVQFKKSQFALIKFRRNVSLFDQGIYTLFQKSINISNLFAYIFIFKQKSVFCKPIDTCKKERKNHNFTHPQLM